MDRDERGAGVVLKPEHRVGLARVGDVDEMVWDARAVGGARLRRADVHPAVELPRIRREDLRPDPFGHAEREAALAGGRRADDRDHVRTAASTVANAGRARATAATTTTIRISNPPTTSGRLRSTSRRSSASSSGERCGGSWRIEKKKLALRSNGSSSARKNAAM